jgi:hypothetical protein
VESASSVLGVGLALIACPVKLGKADQLVIEDKHCKILGVTTKWAVTATSLPIYDHQLSRSMCLRLDFVNGVAVKIVIREQEFQSCRL